MQARACLSPKTSPLSHPVAHREGTTSTAQHMLPGTEEGAIR
jgi:hypothetical protein